MTITKYDIDTLEKTCTYTVELCKILKKSIKDTNEKLFANRTEYEDCLKMKNQIPEDFYYFRAFDVQTRITFNLRLNKYCILLEGMFSDVLNNYKTVTKNSNVYIIGEDFDETLTLWQDVIQDVLNLKVRQCGLF